jgi:branched-chain amino acid transport system substrate-binding protein
MFDGKNNQREGGEAMLRRTFLVATTAAVGVMLLPNIAGAADTLKLGTIFSLTGSYATIEDPALKGAKLAIKQINAAGGVKGQQIELIQYDGKSTLADIANAAQRLVHEDKVTAIVGVADSGFYLASAPIAQDAGIPYIDVGGTVPNLPEQIGEYAHMMPFGDDYQAYVAAEFAMKDLGAKTAFLLRDGDTDYTRAIAQFFQERFQKRGGKVIEESSYHTGDTDYSSHITKIRGTSPPPDIIYAAMNPGDDATFVRQAREAGVKIPIIGGDAFDNPDLVKNGGANNTVDLYFTTHMAMSTDNPLVAKFIDAYKAEYGIPPENAFAGLGYDSVNLMADAMNKATDLSSKAINDAIFTITAFTGVTGNADFSNKSRAPDKEVTIIAVKDGQFVPIGNRKPSAE